MTHDEALASAQKKSFRRLMPFIALLFIVNQLDRTNLSVAGPNGMNADLGLTAAMFGFASGIFFIGYLTLEVPSNLALHRFGARRWLARIIFSWGIVATALAFVPNASWLYGMRVLLGIAEAGFAPGVFLYLTYWFSRQARARATALFLLGIPIAAAFGTPVMSWIVVHTDGLFGMPGWRNVILLTGIPAVLLGIACWFYLTDRPTDAKWLSAAERTALTTVLEEENREHGTGNHNARQALLNPQVWMMAIVPFLILYSLYVLTFFLPTMLKDLSIAANLNWDPVHVGLLAGIPWAVAIVGMLLFAFSSDRKQELSRHCTVAAVVCALGFFWLASTTHNPYIALVATTVALVGVLGALTTFWAMPARMFTGAAAAGGIALVNCLGNLGSFIGPYTFGTLAGFTGSTSSGLIVIGLLMLVVALLMSTKYRRLGAATGTNPVENGGQFVNSPKITKIVAENVSHD